MSKARMYSLSVALLLCLLAASAASAQATGIGQHRVVGEPGPEAEVPRASIEVPLALIGEEPAPLGKRIDALTLKFELDGALYSLEELKQIEAPLSIAIDASSFQSGIARVQRVDAEGPRPKLEQISSESCSRVTAESNTASCVFQDSLNCNNSWQVRVTVPCDSYVTNINNLLTVRSFRLGCGWTRICGSGNCLSACSFYSGAAGTCYNVTSGTVRCAGCTH